jgi:hypothetical protein
MSIADDQLEYAIEKETSLFYLNEETFQVGKIEPFDYDQYVVEYDTPYSIYHYTCPRRLVFETELEAWRVAERLAQEVLLRTQDKIAKLRGL